MLHSLPRVRAFACVILIASASTSVSLLGDTILDTNTFANPQPGGGGFVVATTDPFSLTSADIANVAFEANFSIVDAGVEVNVNGVSLLNTGPDVSNFGPRVFTNTAVQPNNIDFPFSANNSGLPRLTVRSDSNGTNLTGAPFRNSTATVDFLPLFTVNDFTSLLQVGDNVIEIVNLNAFQGANLVGDFTVTLVTPVSTVPEPNSLSLCLLGGVFLLGRRRR